MISQPTLQALRTLLESWGVGADDWYVTGEAAMVLSGYPIDFRAGQMDVLLCRSAWPWPRAEDQVSLLPDVGTKAHDDLEAFEQEHNMIPDFHPLPHVGLCAEDRFDHTYWLPDEAGVRVLSPWAGVWHRKCIIEHYSADPLHGLAAFDQKKFERWKGFISQIREHAVRLGDGKVIETCDEVTPVVERAIRFFDGGADAALENGVKGIAAHVGSGAVTAPVQHWVEGADFTGKIAVLTHSLPAQITKLRHAVGIITDQGGTLSHAAIIAREYKIPTLIGTKRATTLFADGDMVELDTASGVARRLD